MQPEYRYSLLKGSKKFICPRCGKKTFVPFVENATGRILNDYGRCDREVKCGYFEKPTGEHISNKVVWNPYQPVTHVSRGPQTIPDELIFSRYPYNSDIDRFALFLRSRGVTEPSCYDRATTPEGRTIFVQRDYNGMIRTGKVISYDSMTGHRIKSDGMTWLHTLVEDTLAPDWKLNQCLFGEHLLKQRPHDKVVVVESEKSAIIGTICYPEMIWLATGGAAYLKADRKDYISHLSGRDVIVIPDCDKVEEWSKECERREHTIACSITTMDLTPAKTPEDDAGFDMADYLLKGELKPRQTKPESLLEKFCRINPNLTTLINVFGLVQV